MIERDKNTRVLVCDGCGSTFEPYDADDFGIMIAAAKESGWNIRQDANGEYSHFCPDTSCRPNDRLERARRMFGR